VLTDGQTSDARDAIAALHLYQQDPQLWQRVLKVIEQREDAHLLNI
jgi:hypothetical protein